MSTTPITDAAVIYPEEPQFVFADSMRQLETKFMQLKALNTQIAETSLRNAQERDDCKVENAALRAALKVIEPYAADSACTDRQMNVYDACRSIRKYIYTDPLAAAKGTP